MNKIQKWDTQKNEEEFGVFPILTVWDKSGCENRKLIDLQLAKNCWCTEFQTVPASTVSFTSQSKLHELQIQDRFLKKHFVPSHLRNAFYSATDVTIIMNGCICAENCSDGCLAENLELFITEGGQRDIIGNNA